MPKPRPRKPDPKTPQPARAPARENWLLWLGAVLLLTCLIYQPSLDNGFTNWDDNKYVTSRTQSLRTLL